jgi:hypothetical protein
MQLQLSAERSDTRSAGLRGSTVFGRLKMKKTILTIVGSALIIFSAVQLASASEQHRRAHHRASEFRDSNAFVSPAYESAEGYRYTGGWSAPAGR